MVINNTPGLQVQKQINVKLAQAYVPYQQYKDLFPIEEALYRGTIFKELYQPEFKQLMK